MFRRKYSRLLLNLITSLGPPWFLNSRRFFSALLYCRKVILYLLLKSCWIGQLKSGMLLRRRDGELETVSEGRMAVESAGGLSVKYSLVKPTANLAASIP